MKRYPAKKKNRLRRLAETVKEFGRTTSLHGIHYITRKNYHWSETCLWLFVVVLANSCAYLLIIQSWVRYSENPIVISIEKNYRDWNVQFPATTGCFVEKMNLTEAHNLISELWNVEPNTTTYDEHLEFLRNVTNLSYNSLEEFKEFINIKEYTNFKGTELRDIARKLMNKIEYFTADEQNMDFFPVATEMGLCFAYAANVSYFFTLEPTPTPSFDIMTCNYKTPLCGIRLEEFQADIQFYIHGPFEVPDATVAPFLVQKQVELEVMVQFFEMTASPAIRRLSVSQRRCRFTDEAAPGDKFYSYNSCKINCRKRMMKERCGCTPFFYADEDKICDVKGLACVADHKDNILKLIRKPSGCPCHPICNSVEYRLDRVKRTEWRFPAPTNIIFRWSIETFSKTRTKRNIIYGADDLLVSFGGTAALFLGCSVISFVETINFFFLRPFWRFFKK